jgi:hypothetical protein
MNDANIILTDNIIKAIVTTRDPAYRAAALDLDSVDPGIGLTTSNNVLESNDTSLRIGGADGSAVCDVCLDSNTFRKSGDGANRPYVGVTAGYWKSTIKDVTLTDNHFENGAEPSYRWEGSGTKEIAVRIRLTVIAQNPTGEFAAGSNVTVADMGGRIVFSGITAPDGQLGGISLLSAAFRQSSADPNHISMSTKEPFTVKIRSGAASTSRIIDVSASSKLVHFVLPP